MPTLKEELEKVAALRDPDTLKRKRAGFRRQVTLHQKELKARTKLPSSRLRLLDLQTHLDNIERQTEILEAIQDRLYELGEAEESDDAEAPMKVCQDVTVGYKAAIREAEVYDEGMDLKCALERLQKQTASIYSSASLHDEFTELRAQVDKVRRSIRHTASATDSELSVLDKEVDALYDNIFNRVARESRHEIPTASDLTGTEVASTSVAAPTSVTPIVFSAPLPVIELPKFEGHPTAWSSFYKTVQHIMDDQGKSLTENAKWTHLLKSMKHPEARRIVENTGAADNCYTLALKELELKFGKPYLIYPFHVRSLLNQDRLSYDCVSFDSIRREGLTALQGLEQCGGATIEQLVGAMYIERFDTRLRKEWDLYLSQLRNLHLPPDSVHRAGVFSSTSGSRLQPEATSESATTSSSTSDSTTAWDAPPSFYDVLDFIRTRELGMSEFYCDDSKKQSNNRSSKPQAKKSKSVVLKVQSSSSSSTAPSPPVKTCMICDQDCVSLGQCDKFKGMTVTQRHSKAVELKLCLNCLRLGHSTDRCRSHFNCRTCGSRHHSLLHGGFPLVPHSVTSAPTQSNTPLVARINNEVGDGMLGTALIKAVNNDKIYQARAVLDTGARVSVISERLATNLCLHR